MDLFGYQLVQAGVKQYHKAVMQEFLRKDFAKILKHNGLEARRYMKETDSTAMRIYDRSFEGLDITVDLYGSYARILDYGENLLSDEDRLEVLDIVNRFLYVEKDKIIYKARKKRQGREQHEKEDGSLVVEVKESGHLFKAELLKYVDTGLFLDQAETRRSIEESSFGLKVLNLFSYTGSFSVYAASGGAESVTSVDLSNVYSEWAKENMAINGFFDSGKYPVVTADAYQFVNDAVESKKRWDLIIFDPPSFSNSHRAEDFDLKKDYLYYLMSFTKILSDGGIVIFSENLSGFGPEKAKLKPYYKVSELTDGLRAFGFTKKKNSLRIFRLEKVKEFKGEVMRRIQDDESLEHLSLGGEENGRKRERKSYEGPRERRNYHERDNKGQRSYGIERGSYGDSGRERKFSSDRDYRGNRFEGRPERRYAEDRPRRDFGSRPRRTDDNFRTRDGKYDDSWFERQNRQYGDERPGRDYGRRPERRGDERPRQRYEGSARRSYGERNEKDYSERRPRVRKAPVPYGYDEFRQTRTRDDKKKD